MYRDSVLPYSFDNEIVRVVRLGMTLQTKYGFSAQRRLVCESCCQEPLFSKWMGRTWELGSIASLRSPGKLYTKASSETTKVKLLECLVV